MLLELDYQVFSADLSREAIDALHERSYAEVLSDSFNVDVKELGNTPVVVSTRMISPTPARGIVVDSVVEFDYPGGHKLYVGTIHRS